MTTTFRTVKLLLSGAACVLSTGACAISGCPNFEEEDGSCIQIQSLTKFVAEEDTYIEDWESGEAITVDGAKGRIVVVEGEPGKVTFAVTPFTHRGASFEQSAIDEMEDNLVVRSNRDTSGDRNAVDLVVTRDGGQKELGANIEVRLPSDFDGALRLKNRAYGTIGSGHSIDVRFTGDATSIWMDNGALEPCKVNAAASVHGGISTVKSTRVHCEEEIGVSDVSDTVDLQTTFLNAEIRASLVSVAADAANSRLVTEDGDITLTLPADDQHAVQAQVMEEGSIRRSDMPADCNWNPAQEADGSDSDRSGTATCGDGPIFKIQAGTDGVGESNVFLKYD